MGGREVEDGADTLVVIVRQDPIREELVTRVRRLARRLCAHIMHAARTCRSSRIAPSIRRSALDRSGIAGPARFARSSSGKR